jgi:hypothetical protein
MLEAATQGEIYTTDNELTTTTDSYAYATSKICIASMDSEALSMHVASNTLYLYVSLTPIIIIRISLGLSAASWFEWEIRFFNDSM